MRLNLTARRFKLSEELKVYSEKEIRRLKKYYDGIIDAEMILSWEKFYRMAEIKIAVFGTVLTAQERAEDMRKSIKMAVDKLERQLIKYKDKRHGFTHEKVIKEPYTQETYNQSEETLFNDEDL